MAATLAYDERRFKYLASFLYLDDIDDKLLALVSRTEMNYKTIFISILKYKIKLYISNFLIQWDIPSL